MGKGKQLRAKRRGIGAGAGTDLLAHAREVLTRNFQKAIRESAIWPQMVAQFGEPQAEELLKCKGEWKPGLPPDEAGYGPEDI
jgi:hypothetical protein